MYMKNDIIYIKYSRVVALSQKIIKNNSNINTNMRYLVHFKLMSILIGFSSSKYLNIQNIQHTHTP